MCVCVCVCVWEPSCFDTCRERRDRFCIHLRFKMASCRSRWKEQRCGDWISLPITAAWPLRSAVQKHLITKTNYPSGKCITVTNARTYTGGLEDDVYGCRARVCADVCMCVYQCPLSVRSWALFKSLSRLSFISAWPLMFAGLLTPRGQFSLSLSLFPPNNPCLFYA